MKPPISCSCIFAPSDDFSSPPVLDTFTPFVDAFRLKVQRDPSMNQAALVIDALETIATVFAGACRCTDPEAYCRSSIFYAKEQISSITCRVPLKNRGRTDLSGNKLKDYLEETYYTLSCKGPEDQIPTKLGGADRFYCPACWVRKQKWSDMARHLRDRHNVEPKIVKELFSKTSNRMYIRCFGGLSAEQAYQNGIKSNPRSQAGSSSQISTSARLEDQSMQDDSSQAKSVPDSDPATDFDGIGNQHLDNTFTTEVNDPDIDNPDRLALDLCTPTELPWPESQSYSQHEQPWIPPLHVQAQPSTSRSFNTYDSGRLGRSSPGTASRASPSWNYADFLAARSSQCHNQRSRSSYPSPYL